MKIIEDKYGSVWICKSWKQYGFEKGSELASYKGYVDLYCTYEEAISKYEQLSEVYPLLTLGNLCASLPVKEYSVSGDKS